MRTLLFLLVAPAVLFVTLDAIRPTPNMTVADLGFVLAGAGVVLAIAANPSWRIPAPLWLVGAAAIIMGSALLVELIPPDRPSQAALLFPGGLYAPRVEPRGSEVGNLVGAARLAGVLLLAIVIAAAASSALRLRLLAALWVGGVCVSSLVGIFDYLGVESLGSRIGGAVFDDSGPGLVLSRASGLAVHPNTLGLTSAMALPVAVAWLGRSRGARRVLSVGIVLLLVAGVGLSGSRAALLGASVGVALVALLSREARKAAAALAVGTGIVAAIFVLGAAATSAPPTLERFAGDPTAAAPIENRAAIVREVVGEIQGRPLLGHGFQYIRGSHNIYLQLLHAGGVLALLAFLTFAAGMLRVGIRSRHDAQLPLSVRTLASALTAALAVWLVVGLTAPAILERYLYVPAGLLLAISTRSLRDRSNRGLRPSSSHSVSSRASSASSADHLG